MIRIHFYYPETAARVKRFFDSVFMAQASIYVSDLCTLIEENWHDALVNSNEIRDIIEKFRGYTWHRDSIIYDSDFITFNGSVFSISEPCVYPTPGSHQKVDITNCNRYQPKTFKKLKEEKSMRINITGVNSYNDRVVIVRFSDGTFTKSVCSKNDTFDLDIGISICLLKKMMSDVGAGSYSNLIRRIHKMMDDKEKDRKQALEEKAERRKLQEERHQRNVAKAARKAKETYGDAIREAVAEAMKEASK